LLVADKYVFRPDTPHPQHVDKKEEKIFPEISPNVCSIAIASYFNKTVWCEEKIRNNFHSIGLVSNSTLNFKQS